MQILSKGCFYEQRFDDNMRLQNRGIITNVDFDGIILGTSMLENSSAMEASRLIGGKFVNISMGGSSFYERSCVLGFALRNKTIKNVIYSFDSSSYMEMPAPNDGTVSVWEKLYDDSFFNDFFVYYDKKYLVKSVLILIKESNERIANLSFFDRPMAWHQTPYNSVRFGGLENWVENRDLQGVGVFLYKTLPEVISKLQFSAHPQNVVDERKSKAFSYINKYFLNHVEKNSGTTFYVIFPPYYRYVYSEMHQASVDNYALHKAVVEYMVSAAAMYPNLEVYGFEDMHILDDIANYKDTGHYAEKFNTMFHESISAKQHRLTQENIHQYLHKCEELALSFDIKQFYNEAIGISQKKKAIGQ